MKRWKHFTFIINKTWNIRVMTNRTGVKPKGDNNKVDKVNKGGVNSNTKKSNGENYIKTWYMGLGIYVESVGAK